MILAIIPAKGDSLRLPRKNLLKINNVSLVAHAIRYARKSAKVGEIVVATELYEIAQIAAEEGATVVRIGKELCGDTPYSQVLDFVLKSLGLSGLKKISHVVFLQPDHPGRRRTMDEVLDHVLREEIDVLMAVQGDGYYSGAFRVYSAKAISKGLHHTRIRTMMDDCVDINTEEDFNEERLKFTVDLLTRAQLEIGYESLCYFHAKKSYGLIDEYD